MSCTGKKLVIDGKEYVLSEPTAEQSADVVLVRTYSAGVHVGRLVWRDGIDVTLADAHRIWKWSGANTLNELSQKGASGADTRISERVPEVILTEAIEIIKCSVMAAENLRTPRWK